MKIPKCLGICLFYNDEDIVEDAILHLLKNNHEVVVWNHGSTDNTQAMIDKFSNRIVAQHFLPREFDFYKIFEYISSFVITNYASSYDWISFPESDEFLEGPSRSKSYFDYICDVYNSRYDWVQFNNIVYWFTSADDVTIKNPRERIKYYSIWKDCGPRIYAWRASSMNIREFNHNPAIGERYPVLFNTCHYQVRSEQHLIKRINGRVGLTKGNQNYHFDYMRNNIKDLFISPDSLNYDNGDELSLDQVFDWTKYVYGSYERLIDQMSK